MNFKIFACHVKKSDLKNYDHVDLSTYIVITKGVEMKSDSNYA